jgi:hypothetical protein
MFAIICGLSSALVYYEETLIFVGDIIDVDLLVLSGYRGADKFVDIQKREEIIEEIDPTVCDEYSYVENR